MKEGLEVSSIDKIDETDKHHEYRKKILPAYVISYKSDEAIKAYISIIDGEFQTVRHRDWRWFNFLWMTHTMDYQGKDNFNTIVLIAFSLLGLITVLSGFTLWFIFSPSIRKLKKIIINNKKENYGIKSTLKQRKRNEQLHKILFNVRLLFYSNVYHNVFKHI
ncbi:MULTISPECIES: hypothetical protein [Tenacibaculum]|uniref:hypothetical protein n=1 Tax=Tenacibaculum TaxID=104267 RepID=UPI00187BC172|nr:MULTISPECIES: hypothetical protein [Tenacibaculum]MCG8184408.1 hypothetical protein [Tenacibaculum piscium]MCG8205805.1 hypothetical protein [Tenacibaculum piscium]MCG8237315.1 hypothetical protein [Tenacibaculum finnmarkense genomovar ulcerans]